MRFSFSNKAQFIFMGLTICGDIDVRLLHEKYEIFDHLVRSLVLLIEEISFHESRSRPFGFLRIAGGSILEDISQEDLQNIFDDLEILYVDCLLGSKKSDK